MLFSQQEQRHDDTHPRMLQNTFAYLLGPRAELPGTREGRAFRSPFRFEALDGVVLALYVCVLAWAVPHHRPWIDEAQAWLIARDDSMRDMLLRRLHYEGAPPLWHLILKTALALHVPFTGLNWISAGFAIVGIFVLLRYAPFPRIIRWLLPFTFYLQYQYAVVARPYALYPLFLFTLCTVYCLRKPRPVLFGVVAGMLANINAHAGILACVFAALYLYDVLRRADTGQQIERHLVAATAVFVALCSISVLSAFPAPDAMVVPVATGHVKKASPWRVKLLPPERMPVGAPPLDPPLGDLTSMREGKPPEVIGPHEPLYVRAFNRLRIVTPFTLDVATFPVAESNVLAVAFLLLFGGWLWSRGSLKYALPWMVTVPLAAYIWIYDHHTGIFGLALVAAAWISFHQPAGERGPKWLGPATAAAAVLVMLLQIGWTSHAISAERDHPYDPGREVEAFLANHYRGKRIAGFSFQTVSIEPYATHNLFFNWDHTYWLWSNANPIDLRRTEVLVQHPDVVVIGDLIEDSDTLYHQWTPSLPSGGHPYKEMVLYWQEHGYHETHRFCGTRYMRAGADNSICELIYEPNTLTS